METKRILVVDDEPDICEILSLNLTIAGYQVETAYSALQAVELDIKRFDLLLLDVMMDGMSGYELIKILRENPVTEDIPVLFITAKDTEEDIVNGFELGADDYISKPFSIREVLARIKAVLNRTTKTLEEHEVLKYKGMCVDMKKKTASIDNEEVQLTRTELQLLALMIANPRVVFSRQDLIEKVWPNDVIVTDRTVDVNITRLRKKLGKYANSICTRQGFGYYLE